MNVAFLHVCVYFGLLCLAVLSYAAVQFSFSKTILVLINYRVVICSLETIVRGRCSWLGGYLRVEVGLSQGSHGCRAGAFWVASSG